MVGGEKRRMYFECRVQWIVLANGRTDPCGVATFNGEHGSARCSISLVRVSMIKTFNKEMRTLLSKLCSDSVKALAETVPRAALWSTKLRTPLSSLNNHR